jgi:hypothetical protein
MNSMGGDPAGKKYPAVEYRGTGYRHQSTKLVRGEAATSKGMQLFCFADEEPTFAMGDAPGQAATPQPPVTVEVSSGQESAPRAAPEPVQAQETWQRLGFASKSAWKEAGKPQG